MLHRFSDIAKVIIVLEDPLTQKLMTAIIEVRSRGRVLVIKCGFAVIDY